MVDAPAMPRQRPVPESPVNPEEVASVRRPTLQASVLPPRTFHDQDVFDYEQDAWFAGGWVSVGRVEDAESPGQYFLAPVATRRRCSRTSSCGCTWPTQPGIVTRPRS